jgi:hypothetical protein
LGTGTLRAWGVPMAMSLLFLGCGDRDDDLL